MLGMDFMQENSFRVRDYTLVFWPKVTGFVKWINFKYFLIIHEEFLNQTSIFS